MSPAVRYSETLRMQSSTFSELVGIFTITTAPFATLTWFAWRPLGTVLTVALMTAITAVFWLARWQFQVRSDGLYYRQVPFFPVWRPIATVSDVTDVTADYDANGRDILDEEGALFPWSSGNRTIVMDVNGGVRIERSSGCDVFVSSHTPEALASALRAVAA